MLRKSDFKNVHNVIEYMLKNIQYTYSGETRCMGRDVSPEEMRKHEVVDSAIYQLVIFILEDDNPEYMKMAIDYQGDLIAEPGAFRGVYNAIKESKHKEIRDKIYALIEPAARTIVNTWSEPDHFVYDYELDEVIEDAQTFLQDLTVN